MSKILDWIKKHIWQTVLIGFGLFFIPLIIVHIAYRIPAISPWFVSMWNPGELIAYIAGFEALLGTAFLGFTSVYLNENLLKYEKVKIAYERMPDIKVTSSTSNIFLQTELRKFGYPIYQHKDFFSTRGRSATKPSRPYCFYTIVLTPQKNSDLYITSSDIVLRFQTLDNQSATVTYENTPRPTSSYIPHLQMKQYMIYFNLDSKIALNGYDFMGIMTLTLRNSVSEYYILNITFELDFEKEENELIKTTLKITDYLIEPKI